MTEIIKMDIERIRRITDSLTESDLTEAKKILEKIVADHPGGITLLSYLRKIPKNDGSGECFYEYELSKPIAKFMTLVRERYKDPAISSAICSKLISDFFG